MNQKKNKRRYAIGIYYIENDATAASEKYTFLSFDVCA